MRSSTFFLLSLFLISLSSVRSEPDPNPIRLPTDRPFDLCPVSTPPSCPVNCFRTDPVCGVDGVTYWCGCAEAQCSGVRVAKLGFCEVENGSVSGQALLLVHIVWLIVLGFAVLFGLF